MGPPMTRREDWPERLDECVESVRHKPFEYGINDCCSFMAEVLWLIAGVDIMKGLRTYGDKRSAYRIIKHYAGGGVAEAVEKAMEDCGYAEIRPLEAQRGDVVLFETKLGDTAGICIGSKITTPGENGLLFNPLSETKRAWRIA